MVDEIEDAGRHSKVPQRAADLDTLERLVGTWRVTGGAQGTVWAGKRGSPAFYRRTFAADGDSCAGAWDYRDGGATTRRCPHPGERMTESDRAALARSIIDENLYLVLASADESGRPWATPVYYAVAAHREFYWVSSPEVKHSRNIAARPEVGIVIFDSRAPIGTGQGVYIEATAEELTGARPDRGLEVFSARSVAHGGPPWTRDEVQPPEPMRIYRATAWQHSMLAADGGPTIAWSWGRL